jgi:protein gp37
MQKTDIEWADYSWNPVTGCKHHCPYCYASKIAWRFGKTDDAKNFEPTLHAEKLNQLSKNNGIVFCGSNCDLFGEWVDGTWIKVAIDRAYHYCNLRANRAVMFLTKNPARYIKEAVPMIHEFAARDNIWLGTTLDKGFTSSGWDDEFGLHHETPGVEERIQAIRDLDYPNKWLSIEPLDPNYAHWYYDQIMDELGCSGIKWIVIGTKTPGIPKGLRDDDVEEIVAGCRAFNIRVFVKNSVFAAFPQGNWPREFPDALRLATKPAAWSPKPTKKRGAQDG